MWKDRERIRISPVGEIMGTFWKVMEGDEEVVPRVVRMVVLAFVVVVEEEAEDTRVLFLKRPAWISEIVERREETREVWPASSVTSL